LHITLKNLETAHIKYLKTFLHETLICLWNSCE